MYLAVQEDLLVVVDGADESHPIEHTQTKYKGIPVLSETRWLAYVNSIDCLL